MSVLLCSEPGCSECEGSVASRLLAIVVGAAVNDRKQKDDYLNLGDQALQKPHVNIIGFDTYLPGGVRALTLTTV